GISTVQSYHGAQIFEAIGISRTVIDRYFTGTASRISGVDLDVIATECQMRHEKAYPITTRGERSLEHGGWFHFRAQGERHLWHPSVIANLQKAVRQSDDNAYMAYAKRINQQIDGPITLRSMFEFVPGEPVPIEQVEPANEIVRRFATGAMSFGSISAEAHENLAIAMNRIGGKSNTGEGGEKEERFLDERRSA